MRAVIFIGVNTRVYDKYTVKRIGGRYILALYAKLTPIINDKRIKKPDSKHYDEFEKLAIYLKKYYE